MVESETIGDFIDACANDRVEAKRLLNANPGLRTASWLGDESIVMFLAIENCPEGLKFCVQNGFAVNGTPNEFDETPLHNACKLNYPDVVSVLCELGADTNAISQIDDTPLHCCIDNANAAIIEILLAHGADPNYRTSVGESIFDNWPNCADKQAILADVLARHGITRTAG